MQFKPGDGKVTSDINEMPDMQDDARGDSGVTIKTEQRARFTLFPKLLFEIRTMIWDKICKEPRVVEVEVRAYRNPQRPSQPSSIFDFEFKAPIDYGFTPLGPNPAVLHVCKESREQGLKHYARLLQRPLGDINHVPDTIIYMNHAEDTLCILPHNKVQPIDAGFYIAVTSGFPSNSAVSRAAGQKVRRLVIPIPPTARFVDYPTMIILKCTCQLKEVVFATNWEAKPKSQNSESSNSIHRSYANARNLMEPEDGADMEGDALIKGLKDHLDEMAKKYTNDPIPKERQAKVLFGTLTWTRIAA